MITPPRSEEQELAWPLFKMMMYSLVLALNDLTLNPKSKRYQEAYEFIFTESLDRFLEAVELENYRFYGKLPIKDAIRRVAGDKVRTKKMVAVMKEAIKEA
jgi:hypothetical protein